MQKLPNMIDMRRDPDEKSADSVAYNSSPYPWGLCINLGNQELKKLGLDPEDCEIGDMIHMHCLAKVTSVSCDEREGSEGPCHRIELQITHIMDEPENEDAENKDADKRISKRNLYK